MSEEQKDTIKVEPEPEKVSKPRRAEIIQVRKRGRKQRKRFHFVSKDAEKYPEFKDMKFPIDNFFNELVYEDIVMRGDFGKARPVHRIWKYSQEDFPCPMCKKTRDVQFNIQQSGVYLRCWWCNVTFGPELPVDPDTQDDRAVLLFEAFVTPSEANRIVARIGTHRPYGLPKSRAGTRRRRKIS